MKLNRLIAVRGGELLLSGEGKGIKQRKEKTHGHKQYGDYQREREVGGVEKDKGGTSGDRRRLDLEWQTHNTIYR